MGAKTLAIHRSTPTQRLRVSTILSAFGTHPNGRRALENLLDTEINELQHVGSSLQCSLLRRRPPLAPRPEMCVHLLLRCTVAQIVQINCAQVDVALLELERRASPECILGSGDETIQVLACGKYRHLPLQAKASYRTLDCGQIFI